MHTPPDLNQIVEYSSSFTLAALDVVLSPSVLGYSCSCVIKAVHILYMLSMNYDYIVAVCIIPHEFGFRGADFQARSLPVQVVDLLLNLCVLCLR